MKTVKIDISKFKKNKWIKIANEECKVELYSNNKIVDIEFLQNVNFTSPPLIEFTIPSYHAILQIEYDYLDKAINARIYQIEIMKTREIFNKMNKNEAILKYIRVIYEWDLPPLNKNDFEEYINSQMNDCFYTPQTWYYKNKIKNWE